MHIQNSKSVALPDPEIIGGTQKIWAVPGYAHTRGGRRGSEMVPFERALVSFYRPSIVTFPLSLRVQRYCRFCSPGRHFFPTPPLVSQKFPYVPLGVGGSPFLARIVNSFSVSRILLRRIVKQFYRLIKII